MSRPRRIFHADGEVRSLQPMAPKRWRRCEIPIGSPRHFQLNSKDWRDFN